MQGKPGGTLLGIERRIVQLVASGYRNSEIALELFLDEETVVELVGSVSDRLHVSDRLELILYAIIHGMLAEPAATAAERVSPARRQATAA